MSSPSPDAAHVLHVSACAAERVGQTASYLAGLPQHAAALILVPNAAAGLWLASRALPQAGARFGWERATLEQHARALALPALLASGRSYVAGSAAHALCTRVLHELGQRAQLGRFAAVSSQPGFARALCRTVQELRMAEIAPAALAPHDADLARCLAAYEAALSEAQLVDAAGLYALAATAARDQPLAQLVALDVPVLHNAEAHLVRALAAAATRVWVSLPLGDAASLAAFRSALRELPEHVTAPRAPGELGRLQARLFSGNLEPGPRTGEPAEARVRFISAPGESRECVEVARELLAAAHSGVRFDRMAVLVRAVENYRAVLEEALARAAIPAHFETGVRRPAPEGRAFALLLACADSGLSARRFAEYLSLSVVPELGPEHSTPSPRHWEKLLALAAVGGGRTHWERRLLGLSAQWQAEQQRMAADDPQRTRLDQRLASLEALRHFALPLLEQLEALPRRASYQRWQAALAALAASALGDPSHVHALLAELSVLGNHTELSLREVYRLLAPHLSGLLVASEGSGAGKVFVGEIEEARGRSFERVFVLGLAEKLFPPRLLPDPLLPDGVRERVSPGLRRMPERVAQERLALRLAAGAASEQLCLTFPRFDTEHGRPRVPSFYGLEALEAMYGALPGWSELTERADPGAAARLGWPAPRDPERAIDDAEYDLASVALVHGEGPERAGALRYLLDESTHLARALRFRARRWELPKLMAADGFVVRDPRAQELLAAYLPAERSYSPTALAQLSVCPYRFYLQAIARVAARELPPSLSELGARERGVLFHEVQRRTLERLMQSGSPPAAAESEHAKAALDDALAEVQRDAHARFAPPLPRVFDAAFAAMRRDLLGWLSGQAEQREWQPQACELSLRGDEPPGARVPHVKLGSGLRLSGAIDVVERRSVQDGSAPNLRATDWKTGAVPDQLRGITQGGHVLQPLLYALALERMYPEAQVSGGRLYFCTHGARYRSHDVPLNARAREAAEVLYQAAHELIGGGLLPAAPEEGACERCDYRVICGPYEEERVARVKQRELGSQLRSLQLLRRLP